jgi:GT2 family glycosyltransferase
MECDIIIPVWNQLVFTRDCVDSVLRHTTDVDCRLIIVDNASDDRTRRYLEELQKMERPPALLIRNEENLGFLKAANQGMARSRAPYLCVLNNDTLMTRGWLREMIRVAESSGDIGIVNPSSNNLGQKPDRGEPLEHYAARLERDSGGFVELGAAVGFCMLVKRTVIQTIGFFDEVYGMGNFEDTDFSRRAVRAGYRCVRACGAYVYHRESSSFNKIKTFKEDFQRNRQIYESRWGAPRRVAYVLDSDGAGTFERLRDESVRLARGGNWVWYFLRYPMEVPTHSNIRFARLSQTWFYPHAVFMILKRKKKFDEIFVGNEAFGTLLRGLTFLHKAKVGSYY